MGGQDEAAEMIDDGGPAFPTVPLNHGYDPETAGFGTGSQTGLSLRDWFAGQALTGLNHELYDSDGAAFWAYDIADAMLQQRKAKPCTKAH